MEIWKPLSPRISWPLRRWISASAKPTPSSTARTPASSAGLTQLGLDPRARLEVDAEVQALAADRQRADEQDHAGGREEPLRRAHEVEVCHQWCVRLPAPSAVGCMIIRERPIVPSTAWVSSTAVRNDTSVPMPSDEREALHPRRGEHEQDERDHEGHDVRVDDRRQALACSPPRCPRPPICPPRISSLTRSKMTMFASAATPIVRIRPAMPGSVSVIGMSLISAKK